MIHARLAVVEVAPLVEEIGAVARPQDRLEVLLGDDRVRVHVRLVHRRDQPFLPDEFFHVKAL